MTNPTPSRPALALPLAAAPLLLGGCWDRYDVCDPVDPRRIALAPARLSQTGLFADISRGTLADGVRPYRPRFALWSDGAEKRRWVWLPPGARVDTSNMNDWSFPVGTRFWKEFTRDGVRVETRYMERVGPRPDDWLFVAYVWRADALDADVAPAGATNARGTDHDVPAASLCVACHGGRASRALGFSALQLPRDDDGGGASLTALAADGLLTAAPAAPLEVPGGDVARAALGYLHANCGHCHNQTRPAATGARCYDPRNELDFALRVERLSSPEATPTYQSAVGSVVTRGAPDDSALIRLVSRRGSELHMPPLATERVDDGAVQALRRWVSSL